MNKNCELIRDLIPMYVEDLTSDQSNKVIKEHLESCDSCTNYLRDVERDFPSSDMLVGRVENDDQKLMKGIKKKRNRMLFMTILIGFLAGVVGSMMFFNIALVLVVIGIIALFYLAKSRDEFNLERRGINIIIFVLSVASLVISVKLFWNMAVYADDHGSSPVLVTGGWFWLYMDWAKLALLLILSVISGLKVFSNRR